jgi:hypothetical protein
MPNRWHPKEKGGNCKKRSLCRRVDASSSQH